MSIVPNEEGQLKDTAREAVLKGKVTTDGYDDVTGENPRSDYHFEQGTEKSTRNALVHNLETDVAVIAGKDDINLVHESPSDSVHLSIKKTPKGHVMIFDDTIGGERILMKHLSGAGVEIKPDGSIIVNSRNNRVDLITGNHHLYTEGNGTLTYSGDLNMNIGGDFNLDVGGNYSLKVGGHWIVNIFGSYTKRIIGMMTETIQKVKSTTVLKDVSNTFLGKVSTSIKKDYEFVVRGNADYNHKGSTTLTSENETTLTAPNINIVAQDLTVTGDTGTIGGENVVMFNYNMYTGHSITAVDTVTTKSVYATDTLNSQTITGTRINSTSMHASTFHGDLNGTAQNAVVGGTDTHPGSSHGFSVSSTTQAAVDVTAVNTDRGPDASAVSAIKQKPTATTTAVFLDKSAYMVQSVFVDEDDGIYNYLDKTVSTAGVTDKPLTTAEIRTKLRNSNNKSNTSFVQEQVAAGALSSKYSSKVPPHIGRIVGKQPQTRLGSRMIGAIEPTTITNRFTPSDTSKKGIKFIVPEATYNPNNIAEIKMGTLLDSGMPISKFFPNSETMNHLSQIERKRIARNLVGAIKLLKLVKTPKFMDNFNITITEGVQKLGPTDAALPLDSITKLSASGRVVGFTVSNSRTGELAPDVAYDLATYLKDNAEYDKLIMSYDTYQTDIDGSETLFATIISVMPEIPQDYNVKFKQKISTIFNDTSQSEEDLVEISLNETGTNPIADESAPIITPDGLKKIKTKKGYTTFVSAAAWNNFQGFINELEGSLGYTINNIQGHNTTSQRYGNVPNEYTGEDLWTANASGLGININSVTNLKGPKLVTDLPAGITKIAKKYGLGWGGNFENYKDASLFSVRDEEGGTIPAPRKPEVYKTTETKAEIKEEAAISPEEAEVSDAKPNLSLEERKQVQEDQYLARPYGSRQVAEGGIKSTLNRKLFPNRVYKVIPDGDLFKIIRVS